MLLLLFVSGTQSFVGKDDACQCGEGQVKFTVHGKMIPLEHIFLCGIFATQKTSEFTCLGACVLYSSLIPAVIFWSIKAMQCSWLASYTLEFLLA